MNEIIKKNGIKFGVILGLLGISSQVVIYLMGGISQENAILNSVIQIVFWITYLLVRIFQSIQTKKDKVGRMDGCSITRLGVLNTFPPWEPSTVVTKLAWR